MAVVSLLAACLALRVLSDSAWLLALACIAMNLFALVRVRPGAPDYRSVSYCAQDAHDHGVVHAVRSPACLAQARLLGVAGAPPAPSIPGLPEFVAKSRRRASVRSNR
jgi:hypothetical protein